jgi:hypothetical protein
MYGTQDGTADVDVGKAHRNQQHQHKTKNKGHKTHCKENREYCLLDWLDLCLCPTPKSLG